MAASTLVAASDDNQILAIVRFTSDLAYADAGAAVAESQSSRLMMEAEECFLEGRLVELAELVLANANVIFSRVSDKDLECIFTFICNLVKGASSPSDALELVKVISSRVVERPEDKPALRLKILFNLYNLVEYPNVKFYVYKQALALASAGKIIEYILPSFKKIDDLISGWYIGILEQRELFLDIANILRDKSTNEEYKFLSKYLATFSANGEDSSGMTDSKEEAARAIIEFVKSPDLFECELLELPAVAQLENDGKYALIYQLLKVFLTRTLDAYLDFHASNSDLLKSYGLGHEDCITKMRLMSLLDLSAHYHGEIPYDAIRDTLRINDDEVELWVVKALQYKILSCKIDQMNRVVLVSQHTERVFGVQQWQSLRAKLGVWRGNVASAIRIIQFNKPSEGTILTAQGLMTR